jgi:nucleotide-binding universal stress UspA family protein
MKTILVPTDFSEAAKNATEYAVKLAKELNASLFLLHVYHHFPFPETEGQIMIPTPEAIQLEKETDLKNEALRLSKKAGLEVDFEVVLGFAVDEILLKEEKVDIIVMGIHDGTLLEEIFLDSTTTEIMRKTKKPVLVIPPNLKFKKPKKIIFACDFDPNTGIKSYKVLNDFSKIFNSKVLIVNIRANKELAHSDDINVGRRLEKGLSDVEHIYFFHENENLVAEINEFVNDYKGDMIAVIPHHHNLFERIFHNSKSKKMAFHSTVPILSIPDN